MTSEVRTAAETIEQVLALTFDDGPSPWTPPILDVLAEHSVPAAFFVVGDSIEGREDIVRRARDEGHEIGNHTKTHPHLDQLDPESVRDELHSAADTIASVLGNPPRMFRPPYFGLNDDVLRVAHDCGYAHTVCANVYTNDWEATTGAVVAHEILAKVAPGCVIDLHDGRPPFESGSEDRSATAEAVRILVPELLARGYRFTRVSDMLNLF